MESLQLPSQLYTLPTAFKNPLICALVKCTVMLTQLREGINALFFPNQKRIFLKKQKNVLKGKSTYRGCCSASKEWQHRLIGQNYNFFLLEYFSLAAAIASRKGYRCAFKRPVIPSASKQ